MGTPIEIDRELVESFIDDALEVLHAFEAASLALRSGRTSDGLEELFCAAHNLKGASMCIGLEAFGDFVHRVEDVIQWLINGGVAENERVAQVLLAAHACMTTWVRALHSNPTIPPDTSSVLKDLTSLAEQTTVEQVTCLPLEDPMEEEGSAEGNDEEDLQELFQIHRKIYEDDLRAREEREEREGLQPRTSAMSPQSSEDPATSLEAKRQRASARTQETLRVSATKLDELVQLISELSIHQGILREARREDPLVSTAAARALQLSCTLVQEIHAKALELRMQPFSGLMQKLERNAIDLATMQGKQINVVLEGSDVQFDKTVLDKISDPLVHVIRNAIDHGVEYPSQREEAGKPVEATLKISAIQGAGTVSIVVSDDGRGMNDEAIFAAAVRKGIVAPETRLNSLQIKRLIFIQGISTAPRLTEISGRGVGMDIVMRTIQSLRGAIEIESERGKGTTLTITLPTSLSIVDALVVRVQEAQYAVPINELTEVIDLSRHPIEGTGKGGFIMSHRGEVIPVEALADYMPALSPGQIKDTLLVAGHNNRCPALLVRDGDQIVAFAIDRIVSKQQVVVRPLSDKLDGLLGLRGCTIFGDGEPGVILSLPELARTYFSNTGEK